MHTFNKPCLSCGVLSRGTRCGPCATRIDTLRNKQQDTPERRAKKAAYYNPEYQRRAKHVRLTATSCHICGGGPRPTDPWQADHLHPGDTNSPLLPAHRSCNARRGNKPLP